MTRRQARRGGRLGGPRPYVTQLLSVDLPAGSCECPDFRKSSLGLCKHLLAVLMTIYQRPRRLLQARAEEPSAEVARLLGKHSAELPASLKQVVAKRADAAAKKALLVGTPLLVSRGLKQCALRTAIGLPVGSTCATMISIYAK